MKLLSFYAAEGVKSFLICRLRKHSDVFTALEDNDIMA